MNVSKQSWDIQWNVWITPVRNCSMFNISFGLWYPDVVLFLRKIFSCSVKIYTHVYHLDCLKSMFYVIHEMYIYITPWYLHQYNHLHGTVGSESLIDCFQKWPFILILVPNFVYFLYNEIGVIKYVSIYSIG